MSAWTDFVKKVAEQKKIPYREALKVAAPMWEKEKAKKGKKEPTKGQPSKTMKGEEDFTTKKGMKRSTARKAFEK